MSLELCHVSFSYGDFPALQDLSFSCHRGEIVGLIGGNGAGKSTIIKNIVGFLHPDSGTIRMDGQDLTSQTNRSRISYIPDAPVFFEELSLLEHLQFLKAVYPQNELSIDTLVDTLELGPYRQKLPFALSKGTKQKLMIALALLRDYELLIADEPFTALDPAQVAQLKRILLQQKQAQKLVLLSSHLLDLVENICDRFVLLQKGQLRAAGTREELLRLAGLDPKTGSLEEAYLRLVVSHE